MFLHAFKSFPFPNVLSIIRAPKVKVQNISLYNWKSSSTRNWKNMYLCIWYIKCVCMYFKNKNIVLFVSCCYPPSLVFSLYLTHVKWSDPVQFHVELHLTNTCRSEEVWFEVALWNWAQAEARSFEQYCYLLSVACVTCTSGSEGKSVRHIRRELST